LNSFLNSRTLENEFNTSIILTDPYLNKYKKIFLYRAFEHAEIATKGQPSSPLNEQSIIIKIN